MVQWLGLLTFTAEGAGSIPSCGTKILQATWHVSLPRSGQHIRKYLGSRGPGTGGDFVMILRPEGVRWWHVGGI